VANAGLLLAATLAERLGIEQAADQVIDLGEPKACRSREIGDRLGFHWTRVQQILREEQQQA